MMAVQWVSQRASVKGVPTPTPARLTGRGTTEAQHTSLSHCCGFVSEATGPAQAGDLVSLSVHVLGGTAPSCPPWVGGGAPREALGARRPRQQHRRHCAECQRRDLCGLTQARQPPTQCLLSPPLRRGDCLCHQSITYTPASNFPHFHLTLDSRPFPDHAAWDRQ